MIALDAARPKRILLVSLDNLGDLVFASALTPPLHAAFPDAVIDVWCKAYTASVGPLIPHVASIIAADPFWAIQRHTTRPSIPTFLRSILQVNRGHYDLAILSEAPWRAAAAVWAARIPIRVGLARRHNQYFLTHTLPAEDEHEPVVREQARLLEPLGIHQPNPAYQLDASACGEAGANVARDLPPRFAAFHPFASRRDRCVPLHEWTQLAFAMHARDLPVLWVGTPGELNELRRSYTHPKGFYSDHLGDGSLLSTAAALSRATVFAGHDSGPLHIAAAFAVPVVGVFAPGQPDRTFPQGTGPARVIHRPTPEGITAGTILREIDALGLVSTA